MECLSKHVRVSEFKWLVKSNMVVQITTRGYSTSDTHFIPFFPLRLSSSISPAIDGVIAYEIEELAECELLIGLLVFLICNSTNGFL